MFDGVSCSQIAMRRARIRCKNVFACEIDKYALNVSKHHFPRTLQLGDITKLNTSILPKIDLLIGGSPCQSFSNSGKRTGFDGKSGLFWEYVRVLREAKPKYFLLENVKMKREWRNIITDALGVKPIEINSGLVSAQNRVRLYWTNISNVTQPRDKGLKLEIVLRRLAHGYVSEHVKEYQKYPALAAQRPGNKYEIFVDREKSYAIRTSNHVSKISQYYDFHKQAVFTDENQKCFRQLTPEECEELQTIPVGYTAVDGNSKTQRYKQIGNAFTVDVVAHILKHIPHEKPKKKPQQQLQFGFMRR